MKAARGFTLIEVVIAMAIAALALVALFAASAATTRTTDVIRERTWAALVAGNALAELRARDAWPAVGTLDGAARQADRDWRWTAKVSATENAEVRRLDFEVFDAGGAKVGGMVGFIGRPQARAAPPP